MKRLLLAVGCFAGLALACAGATTQGRADAERSDAGSGEGGPPPSASGSNTASSGTNDPGCYAGDLCANLPKPPENLLCADGSRSHVSMCELITDGECGFVASCPEKLRGCFLVNTWDPFLGLKAPKNGPDGAIDPRMKDCRAPSDCTTTEVPTDCCSGTLVTGIGTANVATMTTCAATRKKSFGECTCGTPKLVADDGSSPESSPIDGGVRAFCDAKGQCQSTFLP